MEIGDFAAGLCPITQVLRAGFRGLLLLLEGNECAARLGAGLRARRDRAARSRHDGGSERTGAPGARLGRPCPRQRACGRMARPLRAEHQLAPQ
eukprot:scaffold13765_cov64-Phaeocystis_antarctica.AAC.6